MWDDSHMAKLTNTFEEASRAIAENTPVYAKDRYGDWIRIDAVEYGNGEVRAADHLSGHNSCIVGQWFVPRDIEIQ
jgi:hypothetical protein